MRTEVWNLIRKSDPSKAEWLADEIPELLKREIIDENTARKLAEYYGAPSNSMRVRSRIPLLLSVLGALLISGGVILLFAYNWDELHRAVKVSLAFMPFICASLCGVYAITAGKDVRWLEASALFAAASIAVLIALISQIYHINGLLSDFLKLLLALSLPLIYIFRSNALAAVYSLGLFGLVGGPSAENALNLAYLAGVLPFMGAKLFCEGESRSAVWTRYSVLISMAAFVPMLGPGAWRMSLVSVAVLLFTAGLAYREAGVTADRNPWLAAGWLLFTAVWLASANSKWFLDFSRKTALEFSIESAVNHLWIIPLAAAVVLTFKKRSAIKLASLLLPALMLAAYSDIFQNFPFLLAANALFAIFGALSLAVGIKKRDLAAVNGGIIQLIMLFMTLFFDENFGILKRALCFIAAGAALIALNIYLSRKFKDDDLRRELP